MIALVIVHNQSVVYLGQVKDIDSGKKKVEDEIKRVRPIFSSDMKEDLEEYLEVCDYSDADNHWTWSLREIDMSEGEVPMNLDGK